jgi:hypothetical protein
VLLAGVARLQQLPVSVLFAKLRKICLFPLSCCLKVLPVLSRRPDLCCLLFAVTIAVLSVCRVACRCCSSSATARPGTACRASPPLSSASVLLLGGEGRPQRPPVSLLLAVAVLSVCRVACRCCTTSATARLSTACHASPHLSFPTVLLLAGVDRPQLTPGSLLFAVTIAVLFICRVACRCCSSSATARLCTACRASPPLSFPTVLLLGCVACCQLPPVSLMLAVTIIILSVSRVACRCCSSSATARLCTACSASPQLSFSTVLFLAGVARPPPPPVYLSL